MSEDIKHVVATFIVSAFVTLLTAWLAARQQDKTFDRQQREQERAFDRQERRRALLDRYEAQRKIFEEYELLYQDAYRGLVDRDSSNRRRIAIMQFRARVLFAFGSETFANQVMGVLFLLDSDNRAQKSGAEHNPEIFEKMLIQAQQVESEMLGAIARTAEGLGLPSIEIKTRIDPTVQKAIDDNRVRVATIEKAADATEEGAIEAPESAPRKQKV